MLSSLKKKIRAISEVDPNEEFNHSTIDEFGRQHKTNSIPARNVRLFWFYSLY